MKLTNHEKADKQNSDKEPSNPSHPVGFDSPRAAAWQFIARSLLEGRTRFRISKRQAARIAGISEASWRAMEAGGKNVKGVWFVPNPRPETLFLAARAVDVDPSTLFKALGEEVPERLPLHHTDDELVAKIRQLADRDREEVEELIDFMLSSYSFEGDGDDH